MLFILFSLASRLDADFEEEEVDIEGYDDEESTSRSYSKHESLGSQPQLESEQDSQDVSQFESILLQDLEHSESESDEEDDFPFGDGDDEEEEDVEEEEEQENFSLAAGERNESMNTTEDMSGDEIWLLRQQKLWWDQIHCHTEWEYFITKKWLCQLLQKCGVTLFKNWPKEELPRKWTDMKWVFKPARVTRTICVQLNIFIF